MGHGPFNFCEMCDRLYRRACEHDGIDPEASVVIFSKGNPYKAKLDIVFDQAKYDRLKEVACETHETE
jgi:hypothetical protein